MKSIFTFFVTVCILTTSMAQVTITSAVFPQAGDSVKTAIHLNPQGYSISPPGGHQVWDFTSLQPSVRQSFVFQPASEGGAFADFPTATLMSSDESGQFETYYRVESNAFKVLGFAGGDPSGMIPIDASFGYAPALTEKRAPLEFFDNYIEGTNLSVAFSLDAIPSEILDTLGITSALADSIRISIEIARVDIVDAYGTMMIPGGTYEVLREKRTEYRETRLEIHSLLGWVDVTDFLGEFAQFGSDTTVTYNFHSNAAKEYIVSMTTDQEDNVQQIAYKDNGISSGIFSPAMDVATISVMPNPVSSGEVMTFRHLPSYAANVQVYDASGLSKGVYPLENSSSTFTPISFTPGLYMFVISDEHGIAIGKGKFVITASR